MSKLVDDASSGIFHNLSSAALVEQALIRGEGRLADTGALSVSSGWRTHPSTEDFFIVEEPSTSDSIYWGALNRPFPAEAFDQLWERVFHYLAGRDQFLLEAHVGDDKEHYLPLQLLTELAWHNLFGRTLLVVPETYNAKAKEEWEMLCAPGFFCEPERDGTPSDGCVIINFARRKVLIAGMQHAGEIKKALFSVQSFLLPEKGVLPVYCGANTDAEGATALFFGQTGSGKSSLAASGHYLIGDDAHGWGKEGVFNLEGGCYVRTAHLQQQEDPLIWDAVRFGAVLENVVLDEAGHADYDDLALSDNGRCAYPLSHVRHQRPELPCSEPRSIILLSCDLSGVLPPVAMLSPEAAAYYFLSGYSCRCEGASEDRAESHRMVFSPCFGAPFLPRSPVEYAELLLRRVQAADCRVYLMNTGLSGGGPEQGRRLPLELIRQLVAAIQTESLERQGRIYLPGLNLEVPQSVPGVDSDLLQPRNAWSDGDRYDAAMARLCAAFSKNISHFEVDEAILAAGPEVPEGDLGLNHPDESFIL